MKVSILGRGQAPAARARAMVSMMTRAGFNPRPGTSPGRSCYPRLSWKSTALFQSSAGDKPRPLLIPDQILNGNLCFNPRPGTSPGRSFSASLSCVRSAVSILGRGQAPAARRSRCGPFQRWFVSILGRGQAPAAPLYPSPTLGIVPFQSSAGDKPRPLFSPGGNPADQIEFQSSAGDKPRPLARPTNGASR